MKYRTHLAAAACLVLLLSAPTWAQGRRGGAPQGPPPGQNAAPSPQQMAYDKAVKALADVVAKAKGEFEKTPEWTAAETDLHQAQTDLESAKQAATADLANNSDYQQALADKKQAQTDLDAAKAAGDSPADVTPIATKLMMASSKVGQVERAAADSNPGVKAAKDKVKSAMEAEDALKQKFEEGLKSVPDWVTAKQAVDTAAAALPSPPKGPGPVPKGGGGA